MGSKNELERVKKSARIMSIILKISFTAIIVLIVGSIISMAIINSVSKESWNAILNTTDIINFISLGNLDFNLEKSNMGSENFVKIFNTFFISSIVVLFLSGIIVKQLIKIMEVIQEGTPFTQECSKSIGIIGIVIMLSSVVEPSAISVMEFIIFKMLNIQNVFMVSDQISQVKYTTTYFDGDFLLYGIIIFILGKIFKYGCYLQDEYDSTL